MSENRRNILTQDMFDEFFNDLNKEISKNNIINKKKQEYIKNMINNFKNDIFNLVSKNKKYKEIILNKEKNKKKYLYFISIFKSSIIYYFSNTQENELKTPNTIVKLSINNINKIKNNNQTNIFNPYEKKYIEELNKFKTYKPESNIDNFYKDVCIDVLDKLLKNFQNMKERGTIIIDINKYDRFIDFIKGIKEKMISNIINNIDKNDSTTEFKYYNYITINNSNYTDKYNNLVKKYGDALISFFFNKNPNSENFFKSDNFIKIKKI